MTSVISQASSALYIWAIKLYRREGQEYKRPSLVIMNRTVETDDKHENGANETTAEICRIHGFGAIRSFL